jgi:hypothetical protein
MPCLRCTLPYSALDQSAVTAVALSTEPSGWAPEDSDSPEILKPSKRFGHWRQCSWIAALETSWRSVALPHIPLRHCRPEWQWKYLNAETYTSATRRQNEWNIPIIPGTIVRT